MNRVAPEARSYQSPLAQVQQEPLPPTLRLWPALAATALACLVLLAAFLPVDIAVSAQGRLVADDPPVVLKPAGTAILRELLVRPGTVVARGQLLARLDSRDPETNAAVLAAEARSLRAQVARIEGELAGRSSSAGTPETDLQQQLRSERARNEAAQRQSLVADIARLAAALDAERAERPALDEWLTAARDLETMRRDLMARHNGTRVTVVEAQMARLSAEERMRGHAARLAALASEKEAATARLTAFETGLRRERWEDLARLRPRLAVVTEELAKAARLTHLYDLRAPGPGIVLSVAPGAPGSQLSSAEPVVVIAPPGEHLHVEVGLRSGDAGLVRQGDAVRIKVDAFPWRRHGILRGTLSGVSPVSSAPETGGEAQHVARIALDSSGPLPPGLMAGMTVTADVLTGTRSILDFFLDPLVVGLSESLREP